MQKQYTPPLILLCIFILIICSSLLAGSLNTKAKLAVPAVSENAQLSKDKELNEAEQTILNALANYRLPAGKANVNGKDEFDTYQSILKTHLSRTGVDMNRTASREALKKIIQLAAIINMEQKDDFHSMSLDGRELAVRVSREIYDICGLKLICSLQGDIIRVEDYQGNSLYYEPSSTGTQKFKVNVFVITISVILFFLFLCVYIARKNQFFVKDVAYDGLNKEGYA